jgi:hypothetical protein
MRIILREGFCIFPRLTVNTAKRGAFRLGFDYADSFPVNKESIIPFTGFERKFPDGDA